MPNQLLRTLIYGDPGVGKTRLAVSVCKHDEFWPVVVLDCYGGQTSYSDYINSGMRQPYVIQISTFAHLRLAWSLINDKAGELRKKYGWDFVGQPKTVIIDQITDLQRFATTAIVKEEAGLPNEPGNILPKMEWPGYNRLQLTFLDNTNYFTNIQGVHTIAIAHEEMEDGRYTVMLDGKSKNAIMGRVGFVGRLVPVERMNPQLLERIVASRGGKAIESSVLLCYSGGTFTGKNQYGKAQFFADPDGSMFLNLIGGNQESK